MSTGTTVELDPRFDTSTIDGRIAYIKNRLELATSTAIKSGLRRELDSLEQDKKHDEEIKKWYEARHPELYTKDESTALNDKVSVSGEDNTLTSQESN